MNTNNKTVREKAMYYWNQQIAEFGQYTLTSTHYPDRHPLSLTGREIEKIYLSEHPKEQTKGVIEGLDFKSIELIAEQFRINEGFTDDANISFCSGFYKGQKWFNDTHYMPLLELCGKLVEMKHSLNDEYANDGDGHFDIWQSSKLRDIIEGIEKFTKQ